MRRAFDQVMGHIELGSPVIAVVGSAGTGKTVLLRMVEKACIRKHLAVRLAYRGDLPDLSENKGHQIVLIDEADCVGNTLLETLAQTQTKIAACTVFACTQDRNNRFAKAQAALVPIDGLSGEDAEHFIQNSGAADLFSPDALKLLVDAAGGSIRMLQMLTGLAMFCAGRDKSGLVTSQHVTEAFTSRIFGPPVPEVPDLNSSVLDDHWQVPPDENYEWNALCVDKRIAQWSNTGAPVSACLGIFFRMAASASLVAAAGGALVALALGPALNMAPPAASRGKIIAEASARERVQPAASRLAIAQNRRPHDAVRTVFAPRLSNPEMNRGSDSAPARPLFAWAAAISAGEKKIGWGFAQTSDLIIARDPIAYSVPIPALEVQRPAEFADAHQFARDLVDAIQTAGPTVHPFSNKQPDENQDQTAKSPAIVLTSISARPSADRAGGGDSNSASELPASHGGTAGEPSTATQSAKFLAAADPVGDGASASLPSIATLAGSDPVAATIQTVAQTRAAAKLVMDQAKDGADKAKAAKDAADQTKAAKDLADKAKAAKDAADQAKAAKDAADQGKVAKDSADQAKAAKDAADQAKGAKEAADSAKAAKDAADQAKAAKDSAEQAKAAKEAADSAKAAKDAADQAKAAKEAADSAKAAKDAADQAKAAKDAADSAKAAKDAADQAKAAKDAADSAKAAKDAAEQAKAAKEAADSAKAAKDAADQAKAAKEAADSAKAAKDAADQAKAAKDAIQAAKIARSR